MNMGKLDNKVAIVTGATSGIGRETAILLAKEGASVVFTGRNQDAGKETAEMIAKYSTKSLFISHEVANEDNWIEVIKKTKDHFGLIDILVNNAGQFFLKPVLETTLDDFNQICSVNIDGTWLGMKHCLKEMNDGGSIVNVSSLMGQMGLPEASGYCASKGAVTTMTKAAAIEVAHRNIKINALHPGVVWTPMVGGGDEVDDGLKGFFELETPLREVGLPKNMADAILFLCTTEYLTGSDLNVDGGRLADGAMGSNAT